VNRTYAAFKLGFQNLPMFVLQLVYVLQEKCVGGEDIGHTTVIIALFISATMIVILLIRFIIQGIAKAVKTDFNSMKNFDYITFENEAFKVEEFNNLELLRRTKRLNINLENPHLKNRDCESTFKTSNS
jgi:hypothetical protein